MTELDHVDYRLPTTVVPSRYDLRLEPDLDNATFSGEETVTVEVREPVTEIVLNAAELRIESAAMEDASGAVVEGSVALDEPAERARILFPAPIAPGPWRLRLRFTGILNDRLHGFYRSSYKDAAGVAHTIAATQFEATDARRAFPCWDEPAAKAVFGVTLVVPEGLAAISNTAVVSESPAGPGRRAVTFADSIRMSTYLVAFVVGELEATPPVMVGKTPLRIWCVPGKTHLARVAQQIGAFSLEFFEQYYGLPYPGDKLDLLAIPDFAAGAMENLGAVTFRETALLVDEAAASHTEIERVADVVAHEVAHMWFGDLVTMLWWNGIWLNEAFATFMELLAVDAWKPEWKRWVTFGVSRAAAMGVDGLVNTRPIEFEVKAPKDCEAMFDLLTYEKGASVLRMLEQHIGPERVPRRRSPLPGTAPVRQCRDHRSVEGPRGRLAAAHSRGDGRLDLPPGLSARARRGRWPGPPALPAALHLSGRGRGRALADPDRASRLGQARDHREARAPRRGRRWWCRCPPRPSGRSSMRAGMASTEWAMPRPS